MSCGWFAFEGCPCPFLIAAPSGPSCENLLTGARPGLCLSAFDYLLTILVVQPLQAGNKHSVQPLQAGTFL